MATCNLFANSWLPAVVVTLRREIRPMENVCLVITFLVFFINGNLTSMLKLITLEGYDFMRFNSFFFWIIELQQL